MLGASARMWISAMEFATARVRRARVILRPSLTMVASIARVSLFYSLVFPGSIPISFANIPMLITGEGNVVFTTAGPGPDSAVSNPAMNSVSPFCLESMKSDLGQNTANTTPGTDDSANTPFPEVICPHYFTSSNGALITLTELCRWPQEHWRPRH